MHLLLNKRTNNDASSLNFNKPQGRKLIEHEENCQIAYFSSVIKVYLENVEKHFLKNLYKYKFRTLDFKSSKLWIKVELKAKVWV